MRRFVAVPAAAALFTMVALTVLGCGGGETVEPPPEDWNQIWSLSDQDDPENGNAVFDLPAGYLGVLIKGRDMEDEWRIDLRLVPLGQARKQTIDWTDEEWPREPRPGTVWIGSRTTKEVLPGQYRLEWKGDGIVDVTAYVGN